MATGKTEEYIADLKELARRFAALLDDPHPGIGSWCLMLGSILAEFHAIAEEAGATPGGWDRAGDDW